MSENMKEAFKQSQNERIAENSKVKDVPIRGIQDKELKHQPIRGLPETELKNNDTKTT